MFTRDIHAKRPMRDLRDNMEDGFGRLGLLICRRPWMTVFFCLAAISLMTFQLPAIRVDMSAEALLHKEDPALIQFEAFRERFGRDQYVIIGLSAGNVLEPHILRKLKAFHEELERETPYLDEITSLINIEAIRGDRDEIIVEGLLQDWPEDEAGLERLRGDILSDPLYRDVIISEDGGFTVVLLKPVIHSPISVVAAGDRSPSPRDTESSPRLLSEEEVAEFVDNVTMTCEKYNGPDFPLHLGGDIMVEETLKRITVRTMFFFTALTTLVIIFIFIALFRRLSAVVLPLFVVNCALYSTLGLMAFFGAPITLNTTVLPSFLLAVGIGDSVHILAIFFRRFDVTGDKREAIRDTLAHSGLAVVMTSLTTAGGLLSFSTSGITPIAQLGIFSAAGVMLALLYSLILLPGLLFIVPIRKKNADAADGSLPLLDRLLIRTGDFSTTRPWKVVLGSAAILVVSLLFALQLRFSHNSLAYLSEDLEIRKSTERVDRELGGSLTIEVLVDSGERHGLYSPILMGKIDEAGRMAEELRVSGRPLGRAVAVTDSLKSIHQALNEGKREFYAIPGERELVAQELLLYELGGGKELEKYADREYRRARISIRAPWVDAVEYADLFARLDRDLKRLFGADATVKVTGLVALFCRSLTFIIQSMASSYLIAGGVITLLMILLMGNLKLGLFSMAPNFLPIVAGLGFMRVIGIPLDYTTIMVGGIAIGLAVDDTVHFMHNFRRYHRQRGSAREAVRLTITTTGRAMLFTTLILGAAFFTLSLAELKSTVNFGIVAGFTIVMALFADFFLAPAMLTLLTRKAERQADRIKGRSAAEN